MAHAMQHVPDLSFSSLTLSHREAFLALTKAHSHPSTRVLLRSTSRTLRESRDNFPTVNMHDQCSGNIFFFGIIKLKSDWDNRDSGIFYSFPRGEVEKHLVDVLSERKATEKEAKERVSSGDE